MTKKAKFILLFIWVFIGVVLIAYNQNWAQDTCTSGNYGEVFFDDLTGKIEKDGPRE